MKARGIGSLVGVLVLVVAMALGARSCTAEPSTSPAQPANVAHNGIDGLCANQQAVDDNGGGGSATQQLFGPSGAEQAAGQPGSSAALRQVLGGSAACPTTTTAP